MATDSHQNLTVHLDMEKVQEMLKAQPRFTVTSTVAGKQTTLVEALRVARPGAGALDDNQVNVLC